MHTNFWWTNLKYRDHLEDLGIDGRILNWILRNCDGVGDVECVSGIRIRTGGGFL